jgi:hypothetical protein
MACIDMVREEGVREEEYQAWRKMSALENASHPSGRRV